MPIGLRAELLAVVASMEESDDLAELQRASMRFWDALVEGAGNVAYRFAFNTLSETYRAIAGVMTQVLAAELKDRAGFRGLAKSVCDGDAKKAESHARTLLGKGARGVLEVIAMLESMSAGAEP